MSKKYTKIILIVVAVIVAVGATMGITYAVWSESGKTDFQGGKIEVLNTTYKYLVLQLEKDGEERYLTFDKNENQWVFSAKYQAEYAPLDLGESGVDNFDPMGATVAVIGYTNTNLGELESLEIPEKATVSLNGTTVELAITIINMQSPEMFPSLDLVTEVTIPASVTAINGTSFSFLDNLELVNFLGTKPAISDDAFLDCPKLVTEIR